MSNFLWKFHWDCGRNGELKGLFVAKEEEIAELMNKYCYFGEVLGKHSEVCGNIEESDITKVDLDSETVEKVMKVLGYTWSGFNPKHYIKLDCPVCGYKISTDEWDNDKNMCEYCVSEG